MSNENVNDPILRIIWDLEGRRWILAQDMYVQVVVGPTHRTFVVPAGTCAFGGEELMSLRSNFVLDHLKNIKHPSAEKVAARVLEDDVETASMDQRDTIPSPPPPETIQPPSKLKF